MDLNALTQLKRAPEPVQVQEQGWTREDGTMVWGKPAAMWRTAEYGVRVPLAVEEAIRREERERIRGAASEAVAELDRARAAFPPMRSPHEGFAILEEEFLELRQEVFHGTPERARAEAIQVAAMALRMIGDLYP